MFWKPKLLIFTRVLSDIAVLELKTTDFRMEIKTLIFDRVSSDIAVLELKTTDFPVEIKTLIFRPRLKGYLCFGN